MPRRIYPPELEAYVREHFQTYTARQLAPLIERDLGIVMTPEQVHCYTQNHKIRCGKRGKPLPEKRITTPEVEAFILEHHKGTGYQDMADMVNERFGTSYTADQMNAYYGRRHLNSGLTERFEKGHESANKGKTWDEQGIPKETQEKMLQTAFKKGDIPHNGGTPVGAVRLRKATRNKPNSHPYYYEKVAQPNVWRLKHQLEWERHNGPIPEGCMVTFADGDTTNWHIENLLLETKAQHAIKNRHNIHGNDVASGEVANAIADLASAVAGRRKKHGQRNGGPHHREGQ